MLRSWRALFRFDSGQSHSGREIGMRRNHNILLFSATPSANPEIRRPRPNLLYSVMADMMIRDDSKKVLSDNYVREEVADIIAQQIDRVEERERI